MHICFISLDYPSTSSGGGVGNQVRAIGSGLVREGHAVSVIALKQKGIPDFSVDNGVRVHGISVGPLHWYISKTPGVSSLLTMGLRELEYGWATYRKVMRVHSEKDIDLIEGTESGALLTALLFREAPVIIRLHGEHYTFYKYTSELRLSISLRFARFLQRAAMKTCLLLTSPSRTHALEIRSELGRNSPPIVVLPNVLSFPISETETRPFDTQEKDKEQVVLFVGRLDRVKGIMPFLKAARLISRELPRVKFTLVGGEHPTLNLRDLKKLVAACGMTRSVRFLGYLEHEKLAEQYRSASVCVVPSYYETFGLAALEAMSFGAPVVASDVGGLKEVVEDGITGFLVPPGDHYILANRVVQILGDRELRIRMGSAGREQCLKRWDTKGVLLQTLLVYRNAQEHFRSRSRIAEKFLLQ